MTITAHISPSFGVIPPEDIAHMTAAATTTFDDVPLPPGADAGSTWDDWDGHLRVVSTERRQIDGTTCSVWASAIQLPDGTVDIQEPPLITVEGQDGVTIAQARELAKYLIAAADLLDGWVAR